MKRYRYYSILDSKKETVGLIKAYSLGSAIKKNLHTRLYLRINGMINLPYSPKISEMIMILS